MCTCMYVYVCVCNNYETMYMYMYSILCTCTCIYSSYVCMSLMNCDSIHGTGLFISIQHEEYETMYMYSII